MILVRKIRDTEVHFKLHSFLPAYQKHNVTFHKKTKTNPTISWLLDLTSFTVFSTSTVASILIDTPVILQLNGNSFLLFIFYCFCSYSYGGTIPFFFYFKIAIQELIEKKVSHKFCVFAESWMFIVILPP